MVQAGSNAQLRESFGTPMPALLVNYVLGFTVVLGYTLLTGEPWPAFSRMVGRLVSVAGGVAGAGSCLI